MGTATLFVLAVLALLVVIIDPKYGLFVRWRRRQNRKFTDDYDLLTDEWRRFYDDFKIWADDYKKQCNQDPDNDRRCLLRIMEDMIATTAEALAVAYDNYPWKYPFFWKRHVIYKLLNHAEIILGMYKGIQQIYKDKYEKRP